MLETEIKRWAKKLDAWEAQAVAAQAATGLPFPVLDLHPEVCGVPVEAQRAVARLRDPERQRALAVEAAKLDREADKAEALAAFLDAKGQNGGPGQRERALTLRNMADQHRAEVALARTV